MPSEITYNTYACLYAPYVPCLPNFGLMFARLLRLPFGLEVERRVPGTSSPGRLESLARTVLCCGGERVREGDDDLVCEYCDTPSDQTQRWGIALLRWRTLTRDLGGY